MTRSSFSSAASPITSICSSDYGPLRVFVVQTAKGLFSSSGGYKANICLLRYLASRGHSVRQICYPHRGEVKAYVQKVAKHGGDSQHLDDVVMEDGVQCVALDEEAFTLAFGGNKGESQKAISTETAAYMEVNIPRYSALQGRLSARLQDFVSFLQNEITSFAPTHIMFNDGLSMHATSISEMPELDACRISVIHTAEQLPFGPFFGGMYCHVSSPREAKLLQELDGIWSVSNAIKQYALEHGRLHTEFFTHHPWTYLNQYDHSMPTRLHNWDKRYVGMVNPCVVKGIQIFASIAARCPKHEFLVYKSWGFDTKIEDQLNLLQNVTLRAPCKDMDAAWRDIKVLLVPSLWFEAWGIVVVEAHLRGIPVISSNSGALSEAMLGLDYIIPVNSIRGDVDDDGVYVVPEQNVEPWVETLNKLMSDRSEYEKVSNKVRTTTEQWLRDMDPNALETWLTELASRASRMKL
ncbi:hypothetical protein E8E13_001757 [Curvularia kusanoi]|uniref:Glycosyl transferase family 1 domain-containing protein n=1 Tax=Curvularia kusanoi TaxID=90978 RepID=A0A9P4W694_CURKU|nr:hypothetical protein E8E13_001757 [Curvularia kusanoi]